MELNNEILDAFGIKPKNIRKSKGLFIIEANNTTYKLRTVKINETLIEKTQQINKYLLAHNIKTTDQYFNTVDDKPFFTHKDNTYVLSKYLPLKQNNFVQYENLLLTAKTLGNFHKAVKSTDIDIKTKNTLTSFNDNIKELALIKKRVVAQKNVKDFDLLFLKSSNIYLEKMQQTYDELNTESFMNRLLANNENNTITHNNIKEENFELFKNEIYINNFTKISVNDQLLDLAKLIQRYVKTSENIDISFDTIVSAYSNANTLSDQEYKYLLAFSKYPFRYIKTVLSFYSKNRKFTPTSLLHKLEEEIYIFDKCKSFYK